MTLDELLKINPDNLVANHLESYFNHVGLSNVSKKSMDSIISHFGVKVFAYTNFADIYAITSTDDSNKVMKVWTISIGVMTFVMMLVAIFKP